MSKLYGYCTCGYHGFIGHDKKCPICRKAITDFHKITNEITVAPREWYVRKGVRNFVASE
jgi:hypothetical protein